MKWSPWLSAEERRPIGAGATGGTSAFAYAVTIIIDGATTSEWATRDQYQRLMQQAASAQWASARGGQPQIESGATGSGSSGGDEFGPSEALALGALAEQQLREADAAGASAGAEQAGARSLSELAARGDDEPDATRPQQSLVPDDPLDALEAALMARHDHTRREMGSKRYCGPVLMDVLQLVCGNRFFDGREPVVSEPIIRNRRSAYGGADVGGAPQQQTGLVDADGQQQQQMLSVGRRRRLRTLEGPGANGGLEGANTANNGPADYYPKLRGPANSELGQSRLADNYDGSESSNQLSSLSSVSNHNQQEYLSPLASENKRKKEQQQSLEQQQQLQTATLAAAPEKQHHSSSKGGISSSTSNSDKDNLLQISRSLAGVGGSGVGGDSYEHLGRGPANGVRLGGAHSASWRTNGNGEEQQQLRRVASSRKGKLRLIRGAHSECCVQTCDVEKLKAFCAR